MDISRSQLLSSYFHPLLYSPAMWKEIIRMPVNGTYLEGELVIPEHSHSVVIFAHGSGSSRFSTRNNYIARMLHLSGISTFLFDLLTREEDENYDNRFNIELLTERLVMATKYILQFERLKKFRVGYFGASTGAASTLKAAVDLNKSIAAIVSRGGRPDLVPEVFPHIGAPTLLIIGERDEDVLNLNRKVYEQLQCKKQLAVVEGATHLFEEPGTLEKAGSLAVDWFKKHL